MANRKHIFTIMGVSGGVTVFSRESFVGAPTKRRIRERARKILDKQFQAMGINKFNIYYRKWIRCRTRNHISRELSESRRAEKRQAIRTALIEHELLERYGNGARH